MSGNRSLGNQFERKLAEMLSKHGFWVHIISQNSAGQPADLIAVKNNIATLIDAKVCSYDRFDTYRIESNQVGSLKKWNSCGNRAWYFACLMPDGEIYMVPGIRAVSWEEDRGFRSMNRTALEGYLTIERWCEYFENRSRQ